MIFFFLGEGEFEKVHPKDWKEIKTWPPPKIDSGYAPGLLNTHILVSHHQPLMYSLPM